MARITLPQFNQRQFNGECDRPGGLTRRQITPPGAGDTARRQVETIDGVANGSTQKTTSWWRVNHQMAEKRVAGHHHAPATGGRPAPLAGQPPKPTSTPRGGPAVQRQIGLHGFRPGGNAVRAGRPMGAHHARQQAIVTVEIGMQPQPPASPDWDKLVTAGRQVGARAVKDSDISAR